MKESDLKDMEDGHTAGVIHALFNEFLQERARVVVTKLITSYRNGSLDHDRLVGCAAELACIDDIVNELHNKQRRGFTAREKEIGNAKTL